jgi:hypothetical protein
MEQIDAHESVRPRVGFLPRGIASNQWKKGKEKKEKKRKTWGELTISSKRGVHAHPLSFNIGLLIPSFSPAFTFHPLHRQ